LTIELNIDDNLTDVAEGASIFEAAENIEVYIPTSCLKNGKCRECLVEVSSGMEFLSPRTPEEAHLSDNFRLACRARFQQPEGHVRCRTLRRGTLQIEKAGETVARLAALNPAVTRQNGSVFIDEQLADEWDGPVFGIAMDAGTTTVVMRLVDLEQGHVVASQSFEYPQRFGGSDVMARIRYDTDHHGKLLQRTLLGYMNHAIEGFQVDARSIFEVVVAGNSTMRDILFGLDVEAIGQRPYRSIVENEFRAGKRDTTSLTCDARRLRLPVNPAARVWSLPLISGHIGADAAACLLAIGMQRETKNVALMDIGTNTELLVGNKDRLFAASCPAGPAFEGGLVSCAMPGLEGAIESLQLDGEGISYRVIGNLSPQGICGSGLVDLLSELLRTGQMNHLGRLAEGLSEFVVDSPHRLALSEPDISELAQAKGANVAGIQIVLEKAGLKFNQIDKFYLAGGFASYLNVDSAKRIGLIPNLPDDKIQTVGNAAIEGATLALLSVSVRRELQELISRTEHVELETQASFFDHFVDGCQFVPVGNP